MPRYYGQPRKVRTATLLGTLLHKWGHVDRAFTTADVKKGKAPKRIGNETYGSESYIYIRCDSKEARRELEYALMDEGFDVHTSYWPAGTTVEVKVRYFKGVNWNV
jgi:hypothetical protein